MVATFLRVECVICGVVVLYCLLQVVWWVFLPYGVRCECWRAYILGGVFTGVGYHVCTVSVLVFYSL